MGFTEYCKKFILIGVGEGCKFTMNFYWSQTILTISGTAIKRAFTEREPVKNANLTHLAVTAISQ